METKLITLIELFAATKQTEGKSPRTIIWYTDFLRKFSVFIGDEAKITDFTLDSVRRFIASLQAKTTRFDNHPLTPQQQGGYSPYTIHGYVRTLKVFASWMADEGFTTTNVLVKLKRPKLPTPIVDILSETEMQTLIKEINPNCFYGARLYAIFLLLLDTGIRAQELCSLSQDNVHLDDNYIKVTGKGNKERMVPFSATTKKALLRYLTTWRPEPADAEVKEVFLTNDGLSLEYNGLLQTIKRLGNSFGSNPSRGDRIYSLSERNKAWRVRRVGHTA